MGVRRNLSEVSERVGAGTADFYDKLADNIRTFACSLYNSFPDQITQNKNLAASFARGFMDATCGANGGTVPPAPQSQFVGGQCNFNYNVEITFDYTPPGFPPVNYSEFIIVGLGGPIAKVIPTVIGANNVVRSEFLAPNTTSGITRDSSPVGGTIDPGTIAYNFIPTDGGPDICGNPPPEYPTTTPDVNNDYTTNITINNNDGTDLTIPLVYAPIDFNFPLNFDLGGIDVVIDLGGIDFNFGPGGVGDGGGQLPDGQQDPLPIPEDDPGGGKTTRKFPPPNTEDFDEIIKQPSTEDTELEGELLDYVTLQLTTIPANANTQIWVDGATVYYCGWFAFISDTFVFKREPIHFEFTIWNAPKGATGYQYQLYPGFQATATVYKRKINRDGST